jgi:hypothetical protein
MTHKKALGYASSDVRDTVCLKDSPLRKEMEIMGTNGDQWPDIS